jgi:hypothetical protein
MLDKLTERVYNYSNKLETRRAMSKRLRIAVYTENKYLMQKIRHELLPTAELVLAGEECDLAVRDADTCQKKAAYEIVLSRSGEYDLAVPFRIGALRAIIEGREGGHGLTYNEGDSCAYLDGARIRLTEVEGALLKLLLSGGGEYIGRERILSEIWGSGSTGSVINVYIHYLREKLEVNGERIILSSRNLGYAIDKKYLGG